MGTMRILNPTARRLTRPRHLNPVTAQRRLAILHNHSPIFDRLAAALPGALQALLPAATIDTHCKERYSSGAPAEMLQSLAGCYDVVITGLAA